MRKKINKELLNEEIKKFKLISEYSFYEDKEEDENLILGMNEEDEEAPEDELDMEEPSGDEVELDVTELVKGSEEAKVSADAANEKIDQLMSMVGNLEGQLQSMEAISDKIESLEGELEKRAPTPEEKIEMRSLDSYPYNLKLTDFWGSQEGKYDIMDKEGEEEPKEYLLTKDDVDSDYSEVDMKTSLDDNDYIEDEI